MSDLEKRIQKFEDEYLANLQKWASFVDPDELDTLNHTLHRMETESEAITAAFREKPGPLYEERWQPLLKDTLGLLPSIQSHVEAIRSQSRQTLSLLKKGQRGLKGYRGTVGGRRPILDEDG